MFQAPTGIFFVWGGEVLWLFLWFLCFFHVSNCFPPKLKKLLDGGWVDGGLNNSSFSRIFGFLNLTIPPRLGALLGRPGVNPREYTSPHQTQTHQSNKHANDTEDQWQEENTFSLTPTQ